MQCHEFQQQLDDVIDHRLELPVAVRLHGEACSFAECRDALADYLLVSQAISQWKTCIAPVDLVERVVLDVTSSSAMSRSWMVRGGRRQWRTGLTVACGIALLVSGGLLWWSPATVQTSPDQTAGIQPTNSDGLGSSDSAGYQELGSLYVGWIEGASSRVAESVTSVLLPTVSPPRTEVPRAQNGWLEMWGEQFQPLEEELGRTIQVFSGEEPEDRTQMPAREFDFIS